MDRYFAKIPKTSVGSTTTSSVPSPNPKLVSDPGRRKPIETFDIKIRDNIRRGYISNGPCQPIGHVFPKKQMGGDNRTFRDAWFEGRPWLEYSVFKDAAFCFYCYLFRNRGGDEAFVKTGFSNWRRATVKFSNHVGDVTSSHNQARESFENFKNQRQSITRALTTGKEVMDDQYRKRLTASLHVVHFLLKQGLPFRGDDEGSSALNKGNFLELLDWLSANNEEIAKVVRTNAPGNVQMTSPKIQKQLTSCCAVETTLSILSDLGDRPFAVIGNECGENEVAK